MKKQLSFALTLLFGAACGDSGDPGGVSRLDGGGGNGGGDTGGNTSNERVFEVTVVDGLDSTADVGNLAVARVGPSGLPAIAYAWNRGSDSEIRFVEMNADGTWSAPDTVADPREDFEPAASQVVLPGIGFDFVGGVPHVAYLGGDDDGHPAVEILGDLVLAVRSGGSWSRQILHEGSGEVAADPCWAPVDYCQEGVVVGLYANLEATPAGDGYAVAHRDEHFGFGTDDRKRADLELFESQGGRKTVVDGGRSAGERSDLAFLSDGRIVAAYTLENPTTEINPDITEAPAFDPSVWVALQDGGSWIRTEVSRQSTAVNDRLSVAVGPDDTIWLAYSDPDSVDLVVASSSDEGATWDVERVDEVGSTGLDPSLAVASDGTVLVAYGYCGRASDRDCPGNVAQAGDAVVRLATRAPDTGAWTFQTVDDGEGRGAVGTANSLVVFSDGTIGVAFRDERNSDLLFAREIDS